MHKIRRISVVLAGVCAIVAGMIWYRTFTPEKTVSFVDSTETTAYAETSLSKDDSMEAENSTVCVYICGAVNNPGVVYLLAGDRVIDALTKAGGFREDACENYLNLARVVVDGEQIYVPAWGEELVSVAEDEKGLNTDSGLININTADEKLLTSLPGIGESRARDIVNYRNENGNFSAIEDLMKVSGIKEASFNKIKDYICV